MKKNAFFIILTVILIFCSCNQVITAPEVPEVPVSSELNTKKAMLYFSSEDSMYLIPEQREITYKTEEEFVLRIIDGLIEGPVSKSLFPVLNKDTEIKKVEVKDRVYEITVGENFVSLNTGGSTKEFMALYSITNTLCELEFGDSVRFLNTDGSLLEEFGSFVIDLPLTKDTSIKD